MKNAQVKFDQVSKLYDGDITALDRVTFDITPGEFAFIVGHSGAGKSTLMKLLIREELPTFGDIIFEDLEIKNIPTKMLYEYRQRLGVVFQDLKLIPSKTVAENIEFALEIRGKTKNEIEDTRDYILDIVQMNDRALLFPDQLSGGEKQKVAIARALANDPKLFIADEPTGNLDPASSMEILGILKAINEWGTTVVVITHDDYIVDALNTRVIRLEKGKIVSDMKGGYFTDPSFRDEIKKNLIDIDLTKIQDAIDDKFSLKGIVNNRTIRKKLKKANLVSLEDLLDMTDEEFIRYEITPEEQEELAKELSNYLAKQNG